LALPPAPLTRAWLGSVVWGLAGWMCCSGGALWPLGGRGEGEMRSQGL
jgi:hypothetical protein